MREAQERQLAREAGKAHEVFAHSKDRAPTVKVRWGLLADEAKIAELLVLNGMPRWVAFEERFVVGEYEDRLLAAVRYRTEPKRLILGLLVTDPWSGRGSVGERRLAVALYAGARGLALELGAREILANTDRAGVGYLREAGYRRWGRRLEAGYDAAIAAPPGASRGGLAQVAPAEDLTKNTLEDSVMPIRWRWSASTGRKDSEEAG